MAEVREEWHRGLIDAGVFALQIEQSVAKSTDAPPLTVAEIELDVAKLAAELARPKRKRRG